MNKPSGPCRLPPPDKTSISCGHQLDRDRQLRFELDGVEYSGFAGDSVLSALLAHGMAMAGWHKGHPIALTPSFAPLIAPAANRTNPAAYLPMAQTPLTDGARYVTSAHPNRHSLARAARHWFGPHVRGFSLYYDSPSQLKNPVPPRDTGFGGAFDVVVIGAGVAGLSAAETAMRAGERVALIERRAYAGGDAPLFGQVAGEKDAAEEVGRLVAALAGNVRLFFNSQAQIISPDAVELMQVSDGPQGSKPLRLRLDTQKIVLASGCGTLPPVFPGNRLPGSFGLSDAFHLMSAYAIAPAPEIVIAGAGNTSYRLGRLAVDAGIAVRAVLDTRFDPQSRFRDYAKAYGITLIPGAQIARAALFKAQGLSIDTLSTWPDAVDKKAAQMSAPGLVHGGSLLPRLGLWHAAGGGLIWEGNRLAMAGDVPNIAVAGSAAGHRSLTACLQSGAAAIASLFGRSAKEIDEITLPEQFETPDGSMEPIAPQAGSAPAYLGSKTSLVFHDGAAPSPRPSHRPMKEQRLAIGNRLDADDVINLARMGRIGTGMVSAVLQERAILSKTLFGKPKQPFRYPTQSENDLEVPAYLFGRFGDGATVCQIAGDQERNFETGMLIFVNSDDKLPGQAVGVVLPTRERVQRALIAARYADKQKRLSVRTGNIVFPIRVGDKL